ARCGGVETGLRPSSTTAATRGPLRIGAAAPGNRRRMSDDLRALVLVCTLKPSPSDPTSDLLRRQVLTALDEPGVAGVVVRVVDHDVRFGVTKDEGDGDEWPQIREKMLASDILVVATPIWMGQPASVCKMALERLDAELGETDADGRMLTEDKVALIAVV